MPKRWYDVRLYFPAYGICSAFIHIDAIRGTSYDDALKNAAWNWPSAEIIEFI